MLDNLILEGMAVAFEKIVYPGNGVFPDDPPYEQHFWDLIEPDLYKEDFSRTMEILFGSGDLPEIYGYLEGYKMVKSYLAKHPMLSPVDWLHTDPQVILDEGEHLSNYE